MSRILVLFILVLNCNIALAIESKIVFTIGNEIITNQDIIKEHRYLLILNKELAKLEKEKILSIAQTSIIKEKIKKIEVEKNFNSIKLNENLEKRLFKNLYQRLGFNNKNDFKIHLESNKIEASYIIDKITIEALWNQIISAKYSPLLSINSKKYKEELLYKTNEKSTSYLLSEIIFGVKDKKNIKTKIDEIIKSINEFGFENAASTYSISSTSNTGGKLEWINEKSMNNKILKEIKLINKGEFTKPINIPSGYLILKINDTKDESKNFNLDEELDKKINFEKNKQLNQFSKIYFKKIKKNIVINEN